MIELELSKIKIDDTRNEQVIIFREKEGSRYLPVVIGLAEVNAIKFKLSGVVPPRPLTHDLLTNVIKQLGAQLDKVVIDRLQQSTFFAKIYLKRNDKSAEEIVVDARPSDSVAVALRAGVPIYAAEEVMGQAGVVDI